MTLEAPPRPTSASYNYQWKRFQSWAEQSGRRYLPAAPKDVAEYLVARSGASGGPSTLRVATAAIARVHRDAGQVNPCDHKTVKDTLSSLVLMVTSNPRRVRPLQLDHYRAIREKAHEPRIGKGGHMERDSTARRRGAIDVAMIGLMREARLSAREASDLTWNEVERVRGRTGRVWVRSSEESEPRVVSSDVMTLLSSIRRGADDNEPVLGLSASRIAVRIREAGKQASLEEEFNGDSPRQGMVRDLQTIGVFLLAGQLNVIQNRQTDGQSDRSE